MSNTHYMACKGCEFLLGSEDNFETCPYCKKNVVVMNVYDAEDYRCEDEKGYNYGFPESKEHNPKFYKQLVKEHGYDLKDQEWVEDKYGEWIPKND